MVIPLMRRRAVKGGSLLQQIFLKVRRSFFHMPAPRLDSVPSVDLCSTEENAEVVKEVQREKDSCLTLQRSSEVLSPSSPSTAALETDVSVRDNLDRKTSFNGNVLFCCCLVEAQLLITQPNGADMLGSSGANIRSALLG